ncbi:unnamed protein product [Gadus morhua 'NCC']
MSEGGNELMRAKYEAAVPVYYYKPNYRDCQVLREQWIRAKYQRREFCDPGTKLTYEEETRDGMLMKRGRDNGQFLNRRFVLSEREGTLKYFIKSDGKEPKALIKVDSINASFQPAKIGHLNGLQITYLKDYSTRNIFLYHDSGKVPTLPATITFMSSRLSLGLILLVRVPPTSSAEEVEADELATPPVVADMFAATTRGGLMECCPWSASMAPYHCQVAAVAVPASTPLPVGGSLLLKTGY